MRIVSLIASSTELVCALGFEDQLVGRSHECDFPASVKRLPVCSEPKFDPKGSSAEIDRRVREIVSRSLSVYRVDALKLKELQPDLIVTQDQCEVCAVSLEDVEEAVCDWLGSRPKIVSLKPDGLEDVWKGFERVADALGVREKGRQLVDRSKERMREISEKARRLGPGPSVACVEWFDPLMMAANWIPEFIEMLGGKNLFGHAGERAPRTQWEDVVRRDPDMIVLMPCGWAIERSLEEMPALTRRAGWKDLRAVREGRVFVTESNQYFNRPGPRLVDSLEILAQIMYPGSFDFGHEGTGWRRL